MINAGFPEIIVSRQSRFHYNASQVMPLFSFRKDEILRKKKLTDRLFAEGASFFIYPFKIFWLSVPLETSYPAQILISVGKRSFKNAVDRNSIKRQIREAYRQNKHKLYEFLEKNDRQYIMAFVYTANTRIPSEELELKINAILKRLIVEFNKKLNNPFPTLSDK